MIYLAVVIASIVGTIMIKRFSIIDNPNNRSAHTKPIPTGGGLAIVIAFYLGLIFLYINGDVEVKLLFALLCGLLLVVVSFIDDMVDLSPKLRMITQLLSVLGAFYFLGVFSNFAWYQSLLFMISSLWLINLYNFLDGIDGYAGSEGVIVSFGAYFLYQDSLFIVLAMAIFGFLIFNWQKASIFMGDVGSTFLGFYFAVMAIYHYKDIHDIMIWWILLGVFIVDATFTLFRRAKMREKLSDAHKKHAFQRLVQSGFSHQKVVIYAMAINVISTIMLLTFSRENNLIFLFVCYNLFLFLLLKTIDKRRAF
jgi:Fuc2NAc and GlcNAc transferase